ncbi:helix-turn-helix transcriptional regulator [Algoriphagus machipongonensis]|uniref:Transcriptional regulator n=1 Tax=Algoriphagus machipongonensis TaxID=388413 RepID=A3I1Q3_9BACT|nr:YafY family protein [Algoriphagus machipongonensis]EAZ79719.1 putative transcriptional regulator [Algoriphagus machipongonensis]
MNRIDRLTAILTHLQSKRTIRAIELANRFGVSLRTIYRDVRALEETGVPIIGEAGQGYSLVEGYRLPPVMFTKQEALAFIVAEKLLEKSMDEESNRFFKEALYKVKAILKSEEKDLLGRVDDKIQVFKRENHQSQFKRSKNFQLVLEAISERRVLQGHYTTFEPKKTTERILEPIGIYYSYSNWYLIAYCRLRKDYRTFRIDRFDKIHVLDGSFVLGKHPKFQEFLDKISSEHQLHQIVIRVDNSGLKYLQNAKYDLGFVSEQKGEEATDMTFMNSSLEGFLRGILYMTDMVQIVSPIELRKRLTVLLADIKGKQLSEK